MTLSNEDLKAVTFSEEDLKEPAKFFRVGVHEVTITKAEFQKNKSGKIYLSVMVEGEDNTEGEARIWFTGKAIPYSINTIRTIFVHNAKTEEDKEKLRAFFKTLTDLSLLSEFVGKLEGKQAWLSVQPGESYETEDGETKTSYDKNIWGYEPTFKSKEDDSEKTTDVVPTDVDDEAIDLSEIPFN